MPRGAPGVRRGRKGRENTSSKRKAKVHTEWTPAEIEAAATVKHEANIERVRALIQDSRLRSKAKIQALADNLVDALDQRDMYAELVLKRDLTADEGKAANANRKSILDQLKALGVDSMMNEDDCRACGGAEGGCEECNYTGEVQV